MIAVLTGDIVDSTHRDKAGWLPALKSTLTDWGREGRDWEIYRGDEFQLRLNEPKMALHVAFKIKAHIKAVADTDIRIAIGLGAADPKGEKDPDKSPLTESNGPAFIHSGRKLDEIKRQRILLAIATDNEVLDLEWNLLLQWVLLSADKWSSVSAEIVDLALTHPGHSQTQMATQLNVQQSAVSQRLKRADFDLLWQTLEFFKDKIQSLCS